MIAVPLQLLTFFLFSVNQLTAQPANCLPSWSALGDYCYRLIDVRVAFFPARDSCKQYGEEAELVSIHSEEEYNHVNALVPDGKEAYTGGMVTDLSYEWTDGSASDYPRLIDRKPPAGSCLLMKKGEQFATNNLCVDLHPFICKQLASKSCVDKDATCDTMVDNCKLAAKYDEMLEKCQKTCGFCGCADLSPNCKFQSSRCYASQAIVQNMVKLCPHTCQMCACKDDGVTDCNTMLPFCENSHVAKIIRAKCPATCGLCEKPK